MSQLQHFDRPTIPEAYEAAWAIRREHFGDEVYFHAPSIKQYETSEFAVHDDEEFVPLSITGTACALDCDHCGGTILESMNPVDDTEHLSTVSRALGERDAEGMLLSGGCDPQGRVHHEDYIEGIREAADQDLTVALHTGLVDDPEVAERYAEAGADAALVDVIGAEETIQQVYNMDDRTPADYERTLANLEATDIKPIPHVVVGLHYGELLGEWDALEMIARHDVHALVFVILMPLRGTPMMGVEPPDPETVGEVFRRARELLPETTIMLGCGRPRHDEYSLDVEVSALQSGLNGIAFPSDGVIEFADELGLDPVLEPRCCSL